MICFTVLSLPLRREIGLEKFFKQSLLNSVKRRNLRTMVQNTFQQYESLTMEGCVFQFFNLLSKYHPFDVEKFSNCAVGVRKEGVREGGGGKGEREEGEKKGGRRRGGRGRR